LYVSYIIPVYLAWRSRGTGSAPPRGPWHLGRFGAAINLIAIVWVVFISAILSVPDGLRAAKAIGGLTIALSAWYIFSERQRFKGPSWTSPGR
jgi:hypothetical protein